MTYEQLVTTRGNTLKMSGIWEYERDGHVSLPRAYDVQESHITLEPTAEALAAEGFPWRIRIMIDPDNDFYYVKTKSY